MSLEIYQAIVDTASAVGSLVAVCLARTKLLTFPEIYPIMSKIMNELA